MTIENAICADGTTSATYDGEMEVADMAIVRGWERHPNGGMACICDDAYVNCTPEEIERRYERIREAIRQINRNAAIREMRRKREALVDADENSIGRNGN